MTLQHPAPIAELTVPFDDTQPIAKVARRRRRMIGRIVSLVLSLAIMTALYLWQREQFGTALWVIYGIAIAVSLGWLLFAFLAYRQARQDLDAMGQGVAVRIDRIGVVVGASAARWPEVAALTTRPGGLGRSPLLRLERTDGPPGEVYLDQLPIFPASLDTTARAYSAGRFGVDLRALDT